MAGRFDDCTAESGFYPVPRGLAFLQLAVETVEQREVFLPAVPDHQSSDTAAFFQIFK